MNNSFSTKSFFFYSSKQNMFYASLLDNMKAFFKYVNTWAWETLTWITTQKFHFYLKYLYKLHIPREVNNSKKENGIIHAYVYMSYIRMKFLMINLVIPWKGLAWAATHFSAIESVNSRYKCFFPRSCNKNSAAKFSQFGK